MLILLGLTKTSLLHGVWSPFLNLVKVGNLFIKAIYGCHRQSVANYR